MMIDHCVEINTKTCKHVGSIVLVASIICHKTRLLCDTDFQVRYHNMDLRCKFHRIDISTNYIGQQQKDFFVFDLILHLEIQSKRSIQFP